tara:strand:- start:56 stop:811 length:756 start_codon:yes stop_codon:yes gene_type:complete
MKLYFAGSEVDFQGSNPYGVLYEANARILISYTAKDMILKSKIFDRFDDVFIDSGAFSVYTVGATVDIDEYIQFIKEHKVKIYASLDDIKDPEQSYTNYKYMLAHNLNPIPVFHYGEDIQYLKKYLDCTDYVALGGIVRLKNQIKMLKRFFDMSFSIVKDKAKIHGLGVINWELLQQYPFYSVDATSWHNPQRYGQHFSYREGRLKRIDGRRLNIHRFQTKRDQLLNSVRELQKAEEYITKLWAKRGIIYE